MILEPGEKLHIVERRFFSDDVQRHVVGEVLACTEQVVRLQGYIWVFDVTDGRFIRKPEKRERIIPLHGRLTINVIPRDVDPSMVKYVADPQRGLQVTAGQGFCLDISEFGVKR
jgi:hypothetical protein